MSRTERRHITNKVEYAMHRAAITIMFIASSLKLGYAQEHTQKYKNKDLEIEQDTLLIASNDTIITIDSDTLKREPILAIKTNLLFGALLMPNVEVEVPLGKRWSIAGEWMFPWWVTRDNGNALQILAGHLEGRYWLGNRTDKQKMTGWFTGLYAGGGYYDLQYKNNGYQGEFFIAAGVSAGYAHKINKRGTLRMEYSLGVGFLQTNYRYYEGYENNEYLVWQYDGNYSWFGPTKAKVSLVWMFNSKKKRDR